MNNIKLYNVYAQETIDRETLFYLESLEDKWFSQGAFKTPEKLGRNIIYLLSQGGLDLEFYKSKIPDITNASPKQSKRDYGIIFGEMKENSQKDLTILIRALENNEMMSIYEEIQKLRIKAKNLKEFISNAKGADGKINPAFLQRIMWEKELLA